MSIHTCSYYCERPECIKAQRDELRQKLEQAEKQEPVAQYSDIVSDGGLDPRNVHAIDMSQERVDETAKNRHDDKGEEYMKGNVCKDATIEGLTTLLKLEREGNLALAKREWVGLTDEEVKKIVDLNTEDDYGYDIWCNGRAVARDVEAKLKEKNT